jgi:hypothetical protein
MASRHRAPTAGVTAYDADYASPDEVAEPAGANSLKDAEKPWRFVPSSTGVLK